MTNLINQKCMGHKQIVALTQKEIKNYLSELKEGWKLKVVKIEKLFNFDDFNKAMEFVNKIAELAEREGHHPDIEIHYNKVEIILWTHAIGGLSENDFILAAKIDNI